MRHIFIRYERGRAGQYNLVSIYSAWYRHRTGQGNLILYYHSVLWRRLHISGGASRYPCVEPTSSFAGSTFFFLSLAFQLIARVHACQRFCAKMCEAFWRVRTTFSCCLSLACAILFTCLRDCFNRKMSYKHPKQNMHLDGELERNPFTKGTKTRLYHT